MLQKVDVIIKTKMIQTEIIIKGILQEIGDFKIVKDIADVQEGIFFIEIDDQEIDKYITIISTLQKTSKFIGFICLHDNNKEISQNNLIRLMRSGVQDIIDVNIKHDDFVYAVSGLLEKYTKNKNVSNEKKKIISFIGSKGGNGTTLISSTIATYLSFKYKTLYIDASLPHLNAPVLFEKEYSSTWFDLISNIERIDDVYIKNEVVYKDDLMILPAPDTKDLSIVFDSNIRNNMQSFLTICSQYFDYIIVDCGSIPEYNHISGILDISDIINIVTEPTALSLANCVRNKQIISDMINNQHIKILLNKHKIPFGINDESIYEIFGKQVDGRITYSAFDANEVFSNNVTFERKNVFVKECIQYIDNILNLEKSNLVKHPTINFFSKLFKKR